MHHEDAEMAFITSPDTESPQSDLEESCRRAFYTSVLLTGSLLYAESAVLEAIELWNPDDTVQAAFIRHAIDRSVQSREAADIQAACQLLPEELRAVLHLPERLRHCFVLRVLVKLSRQACARILDLPVLQVHRYTIAAVARLSLHRMGDQFSAPVMGKGIK